MRRNPLSQRHDDGPRRIAARAVGEQQEPPNPAARKRHRQENQDRQSGTDKDRSPLPPLASEARAEKASESCAELHGADPHPARHDGQPPGALHQFADKHQDAHVREGPQGGVPEEQHQPPSSLGRDRRGWSVIFALPGDRRRRPSRVAQQQGPYCQQRYAGQRAQGGCPHPAVTPDHLAHEQRTGTAAGDPDGHDNAHASRPVRMRDVSGRAEAGRVKRTAGERAGGHEDHQQPVAAHNADGAHRQDGRGRRQQDDVPLHAPPAVARQTEHHARQAVGHAVEAQQQAHRSVAHAQVAAESAQQGRGQGPVGVGQQVRYVQSDQPAAPAGDGERGGLMPVIFGLLLRHAAPQRGDAQVDRMN